MRKLIKKLNRWYVKQDKDFTLTNWQRDVIYEFTIDHIKGVKKYNGRK